MCPGEHNRLLAELIYDLKNNCKLSDEFTSHCTKAVAKLDLYYLCTRPL